MFSLLPLVNHMIGPRETLWQALICRNLGQIMIVSCDYTGNGNNFWEVVIIIPTSGRIW
jgi:ATP sulfurylase